MRSKGNYGLDSPGIMGALVGLGVALSVVAYLVPSGWRWVAYGFGGYFLLGAVDSEFRSGQDISRCGQEKLDRDQPRSITCGGLTGR